MAVPGVTQPGGVCNRSVSLLDLYPTLCELTGITAPPDLQGHSLAPLLKNPQAEWNYPCFTFSTTPPDVTVVQGPWRYIQYQDGSRELYNHDTDPCEWNNLASLPESQGRMADMAATVPPSKTTFIGTRKENPKENKVAKPKTQKPKAQRLRGRVTDANG